jgi:muramoyltetrapeptide carboxypeptidase
MVRQGHLNDFADRCVGKLGHHCDVTRVATRGNTGKEGKWGEGKGTDPSSSGLTAAGQSGMMMVHQQGCPVPTRRSMILGLSAALAAELAIAPSLSAPRGAVPTPAKPPRLRIGDTIGLIEPASATDDAFDITLAEEAMTALGLKPKRAPHLLGRSGYFSGADKDRAADVNAMFADDEVRAIFAVRGGWGCARILPYLDYDLIRAHPKLLIGYSDITALHMAIAARAGFTTIHGPVAVSAWGKASVASLKQVAFDGALATYQNPIALDDRLAQKKWRTQTITGGTARGRLLGGNLTVLSALTGTPYLPNFDGAILFLEDIDEAEYRIDRMLTQLGQAGILKGLAGVIFGQCTDCKAREGNSYGGFTLSDVLRQHLGTLGIPAFQGAFIGHMPDQFSIPIGIKAEMDASAGTLRLLESAVS